MYDHYFTGSDVNIYLRYPETDRQLHIDKALGIGFTHSRSSAPVYVLGNVNPAFFSRGNSLIQGNLDLAFTSIKYLQVAVKYLLNISDSTAERDKLLNKSTPLTETEVRTLFILQNRVMTDMDSISISELFHLFEIIIEFDNANSNTDGTGRNSIVIEGVNITSNGMSVYSTEESSLVNRYTFLAKNIRGL